MKQEEICGLYRFKNKQNQIIYIGKADKIYTRLKQHRHLPEACYDEINQIEYCIIDNKLDRDILEVILISKLQPKYNTQSKYRETSSLISDEQLKLSWTPLIDSQFNFKKHHQSYINMQHTGKTGRQRIELPEKFYELYPQWKAGNIKAVEFRKIINMTKPTFYRRVKEYETLLSKESE